MSDKKLQERLDRVNEIYARKKLGENVYYRAPEARPTVASDQILALLEVMSEEIERLEGLIRGPDTCCEFC